MNCKIGENAEYAQNVEKLQKLDIVKKKVKKFVFAKNAVQN